jgi:hypothetical protein
MLSLTYFEIASSTKQPAREINLFNLSLSVIGIIPILLYVVLVLDDLFGIFLF